MKLTTNGCTAPNGEFDEYGEEHQNDDRGPPETDALPAIQPDLAAPTNGLDSAPETVVDVEPDGTEPDDVQHHEDGLSEGLLDPGVTVAGRGQLDISITHQLTPHHVVPEVVEVKAESQANDDTQHQHVLTGPLHLFGLVGNIVRIGTASLLVLQCQPDGINEVQCHQGRQANGCDHGIPVGAEEFADHVVAFCAEQGHYVHARMKRQEEN